MTDKALADRIAGVVLGFAIGDALGAPAAGVKADQVLSEIGPIYSFCSNQHHPRFSALQPGQFTENTVLLIDAIHDAISCCSFSRKARIGTLTKWSKHLTGYSDAGRWPGPTTLLGARHLWDIRCPRPKNSESVGACYRVLPLAAVIHDSYELAVAAEAEVGLTHLGVEARLAGVIYALAIQAVVHGEPQIDALSSAVERACEHFSESEQTNLAQLCRLAVESRELPVDRLRDRFGTGALARESLPLSFSITVKHRYHFREAIIAGANSFRPNDVEPPSPCNSAADDIQAANGGNTDGIAAIVGSLTGGSLGISAIDTEWLAVERADELLSLSHQLASCATSNRSHTS